MSSPDPFGAAPPPNYDYLDTYEQDYKPERRYAAGLDSLADGPHEFEILSAQIVTAQNGKPILEAMCKVDGGTTIKHSWWHDTQDKFNSMCADLLILGFDADKWGKFGKPIREALPAAVARMAGLRFRGVKTSKLEELKPGALGSPRTFHNLNINSLIRGGGGSTSHSPMPSPVPDFDETQRSLQVAAAPSANGPSSW